MKTEGKAELINGRIVHYMATGHRPSPVAGRIFRSLDEHVEATGKGFAYTDNMGFAVPELSTGRESSPRTPPISPAPSPRTRWPS